MKEVVDLQHDPEKSFTKPLATGKGNDTLQLATTINYNVITMTTKTLCSLEDHWCIESYKIIRSQRQALSNSTSNNILMYWIQSRSNCFYTTLYMNYCRSWTCNSFLSAAAGRPFTAINNMDNTIVQNSCMRPKFYTN